MSLITNRRVLRTEIPPEEMHLREGQMDHLRSVLEPIQFGQRVDGAFIYGPPGGGKTHAAQLLVARLQQAAGHVRSAHIDCWNHNTHSAIVTQLLEGLGGAATPTNAAGYELMEQLRDTLESPYVVILDEADQIEDDRTLYELDADMRRSAANSLPTRLAAKLWRARTDPAVGDDPWKHDCKDIKDYLEASDLKHWIRQTGGRRQRDLRQEARLPHDRRDPRPL